MHTIPRKNCSAVDPGYMDAHLHLQDERFVKHRDEVIHRAESSGVNRMLCNATREKDWGKVLRLAEKNPSVRPFLGVHPWYADTVSDRWHHHLGALVEKSGCGIGETGLDKACGVELKVQQAVFLRQLELALEYGRPLVIHCVRAWGMLRESLQPVGQDGLRFMVHSFAGSTETMLQLVELGGYISFSLTMLQQGRKKLQDVFVRTPVERVLLETDAPDQGVFSLCEGDITGCNEPVCVVELYRQAAELKGMQLDEFRSIIWNNGTIFTNP